MKKEIGDILRTSRKAKGLTISDVVEQLKGHGVVVASKTVYGWENDYSYPSVYIFLLLCELYGITDILGTFAEE